MKTITISKKDLKHKKYENAKVTIDNRKRYENIHNRRWTVYNDALCRGVLDTTTKQE